MWITYELIWYFYQLFDTRILTAPIHYVFVSFFSILWKSMASSNCLITKIIQNIFFGVQQKKETCIGLEQLEG